MTEPRLVPAGWQGRGSITASDARGAVPTLLLFVMRQVVRHLTASCRRYHKQNQRQHQDPEQCMAYENATKDGKQE